MKKIKAYIDYNDYNKTHYYEEFEIIDELPEIGDYKNGGKIIKIEYATLDCEQPNSDVYDYTFYKITTKDDEDEENNFYACIEIKDGEDD